MASVGPLTEGNPDPVWLGGYVPESKDLPSLSDSNLTEIQQRAMGDLFRKVAPVADELGRLFAAQGHELALVGGPVRDVLLGRVGNDLDLTTDARPERVLEIVRDWADAVWTIGIDFGTVGLRKGGWLIEITTYRSEAYDPKSRKPEVDVRRRRWRTTWRGATSRSTRWRYACRRTSSSTRYGGLADLARQGAAHARHPRAVLRRRPAAHAARRQVRLPARVHRWTPAALAAMTAMAERIEIVSAERIRDELDKLICGALPARGPARSSWRPGWPRTSCPSCPSSGWRSTSTTGTRTSTSTR